MNIKNNLASLDAGELAIMDSIFSPHGFALEETEKEQKEETQYAIWSILHPDYQKP